MVQCNKRKNYNFYENPRYFIFVLRKVTNILEKIIIRIKKIKKIEKDGNSTERKWKESAIISLNEDKCLTNHEVNIL